MVHYLSPICRLSSAVRRRLSAIYRLVSVVCHTLSANRLLPFAVRRPLSGEHRPLHEAVVGLLGVIPSFIFVRKKINAELEKERHKRMEAQHKRRIDSYMSK